MKTRILARAALTSLLLMLAYGLSGLSGHANALNNHKLTEDTEANESTAQESADRRFKGTIGQAKFEMILRREGSELQGSYFYVKSGSANKLSLRGKIDGSGNFSLQESDASGKQTGEFKGVWKDDPNQSGASLEGEWKKPNAKDPQGFWAYEQTVSFTNGTQVITRQINESVKAKRLDLSAEYPELAGGANASGFNQLVKSRVSNELAAFRKQMMASTAADLKMLPEGVNNYLEIGYNVEYADNDLISVTFLASNFTGGAHPNHNYFTITYDLKSGRELKLPELFKPGAKYLEAVSAYATQDLQSRKVPETNENMGLAQDLFEDGAKPKPENYQSWSITKKGLMFIFDPYQVGPYAVGSQTVIVPYARLRDIARPDGVLAKMAR